VLSNTTPLGDDEVLQVVPLRHPWRLSAAGFLIVTLAGTIWSIAKNPNVEWSIVGHYFFSGLVVNGVLVTLYLTFIAMVIGIVGAVGVAVMRLSENPVLSSIAKFYIWFFRGTPVLIQIIFWGYIGALYPQVKLGIPFTHVTFWSTGSSAVITPMLAAILSLGLNEIAYSGEIIRGGISGVAKGQAEAAYSLGLTPAQTTRKIVLPQAMRIVVPPMGNEVLTMLKETALVSVIAGRDLMTAVQQIYSQNYQVIPLLVVAGIWYLLLTSLLSYPQRVLERRYGRSRVSALGSSGTRRLLVGFTGSMKGTP
jgi:polar amino acid transport system permease protein